MLTRATKGIHQGKPLWNTQVEAIKFISESQKDFIALCIPTGGGKTQLAMEAIEPPLFYLTNSKQLQDQVQHDFPNIVVLKGKENYACNLSEGLTADDCIRDKKCPDCEYYVTKNRAMRSDFTILNFSYFLTVANFTDFIQKDRVIHEGLRNIIIDEADVLDEVLTKFISLDFSLKRIHALDIHIPEPKRKTVFEEAINFLRELRQHCQIRIQILESMVEPLKHKTGYDLSPAEIRLIRKLKQTKSLYEKCNTILESNPISDQWVYYFSDDIFHFNPKWLTRVLTDKFLFKYGSRFLLMSATLQQKHILCGLLGIEPEEMDYREFPSAFPSENRLFYLRPKYSLSHKEEYNANKIRKEVKQILDLEKNHKGIIHTVSFKVSEILHNLDPRLIFHNSHDKDEQFQKFLNSKNGVFVSPSSVRGIDLKEDLGRFVIWVKAPYLDLSEPLTNARLFSSGKWGKIWYKATCAQELIQGIGRICRSPSDWGRSYLLDEQGVRLIRDNPKLFPLWFREAIIYEGI